MRAYINKDTPYELSWSIEDQITPELIDQIKDAGNELEIDWLKSPLGDILDILLTKYTKEKIIEMIYDEDETILELLEIDIINELSGWIMTIPQNNIDDVREFSRLYLPILLIILEMRNKKY